MGLEKIAPANSNFYAPRFEIEIESKKLQAEISKQITNVEVEEKVDEGASFAFTMNDEFDMKTQEFKWLDHEFFKEGNRVTIKMGYSDNLFTMIIGKIDGIEPSFFSGEIPTFTIRGKDLSQDYLKKKSPERAFVDKKYSDIARTIASEAGLLPVIEETGKADPVTRKNNDESYLVFLNRLKDKAGVFQFDIEGRTMYFVKPGDDQKEILTLELKKDIISFRSGLKTTGIVTEVETRSHNINDPKNPIIGRAKAGSEKTQESGKKTASQLAKDRYGDVKKVVTNIVVTSEEQAMANSRSELNKASDGLIQGNGECIGLPQLRKGVNIRLEKMGKRFSGKYYVISTTHTINESGYRTSFSVKRNAI